MTATNWVGLAVLAVACVGVIIWVFVSKRIG